MNTGTDRDRQDFDEWWRTVHPRGTTAFFAEDHWSTFQAALRIAADRREQEEPVAALFVNRNSPEDVGCAEAHEIPWFIKQGNFDLTYLILRDPEEKQC